MLALIFGLVEEWTESCGIFDFFGVGIEAKEEFSMVIGPGG